MYGNNKGFTIMEAIVGIGLLGIVMVTGTQGYDYIKQSQTKMVTMNTTENRVSEIIQTVKANISQQIISFPASASSTTGSSAESGDTLVTNYIESVLGSNLPMAWSLNTDSTAAECASCPGRYGYVITAIPGYGGLYLVSIRFTHTDWGDTPKKFSFVVSQ
jgi:hypothetical protein